MPDHEIDDDVGEIASNPLLRQILKSQADMQAMLQRQNEIIDEQRRENEALRRQLTSTNQVAQSEGMKYYRAPKLSEDERWRIMESDGGLLG